MGATCNRWRYRVKHRRGRPPHQLRTRFRRLHFEQLELRALLDAALPAADLPQPCPLAFTDAGLVQAAGQILQVNAYSVPSLADFNADGPPDLIVGEKTAAGEGKVRVYLNTGTAAAPAFGSHFYVQANGADLSVPAEGCLGVFPRLFDWDGDGKQDLLTGLADGRVALWRNVGTAAALQFDQPSVLQVGPPEARQEINVGARATLDIVDFNVDGRYDLLVGGKDGKVRVYLNQAVSGPADFPSQMILQDASGDLTVPSGRSSVALVDLDGDGRKDLLTGNTEGQLLLYRNVGSDAAPAFNTAEPILVGGAAVDLPGTPRSRPFACDFNADGTPDLLLGAADGLVQIYLGSSPLPVGEGQGVRAEGGGSTGSSSLFAQVPLRTEPSASSNREEEPVLAWPSQPSTDSGGCPIPGSPETLNSAGQPPLPPNALDLLDASGKPVPIQFDQNTLLVALATWCHYSQQFITWLRQPQVQGQLTGLRVVLAFGDESALGRGSIYDPAWLENDPGEVLFIDAQSPAQPTAFPTVYDPKLGQFSRQTSPYAWIDQWSSSGGGTSLSAAKGVVAAECGPKALGSPSPGPRPGDSMPSPAGGRANGPMAPQQNGWPVGPGELGSSTPSSPGRCPGLDEPSPFGANGALSPPATTPFVAQGVPPSLSPAAATPLVPQGVPAGTAQGVPADGLMSPLDTQPTYSHRVFVTSFMTQITNSTTVPPSANDMFGGQDAADWVCTMAAYDAGLLYNWNGLDLIYKAILSTPSSFARDRIPISGPMYNMHGDLVATGASDLWDRSLMAPISYDEYGNLISGFSESWSGSNSDGTYFDGSCGNWNNSTSMYSARLGKAFLLDGRWLSYSFQPCDLTARLYCVSPAIVVRTWQGSGGDDRWTTPQNWLGDQAPGAGDSLVFPAGAARSSNTNDYPAGTIFGGLTLSGGGYTIGGNPFVLPGGLTNTADPATPNVISAGVSNPAAWDGKLQNNGTLLVTGAFGSDNYGRIIVRGTGTLIIAGPQNWGPGTTLVFGGPGSSAAESLGAAADFSPLPQAGEGPGVRADDAAAGEPLGVVAASTRPHPSPLPEGEGTGNSPLPQAGVGTGDSPCPTMRSASKLPAARLESISPQAFDAVLGGAVVQQPPHTKAWAAELAWLWQFERFASQQHEPKNDSALAAPVDEFLANHWC